MKINLEHELKQPLKKMENCVKNRMEKCFRSIPNEYRNFSKIYPRKKDEKRTF